MVRKAARPDSYEEGMNMALKLLQRAAQTEKGLRGKLERRQYIHGVIDRVVARLKEMNLIDDDKYARDYVAYRSRNAPLGAYSLQVKLQQKGIERDLAKEASALSSEDELKLARELAAKRINRLIRYSHEERKLKLARFLASRGFSSSVIIQIVRDNTE